MSSKHRDSRLAPLIIPVVLLAAACMPSRAEDATLIIPGPGDETQVPYCDIVEAVLAKFSLSNIFPNDNGFMRRVAYTESAGTISATVGQGGHGPWAAKKFMLEITQTTNTTLSDFNAVDPLRRAILNSTVFRNEVGGYLDWQQIPFELLKIPLLSAVAVRLYLHVLVSRDPTLLAVPLRLDTQAALWAKDFTDTMPSSTGLDERASMYINNTRKFDDQCACHSDVDMAFVIDMSGSVRAANFKLATGFAADIAASFDINPNGSRVALITYSTSYTINFDFDKYGTAQSAAAALRAAPYKNGNTRTGKAITAMTKQLFMLNITKPTTAAPTTMAATTSTTEQASDPGSPGAGEGGGGAFISTPPPELSTQNPTVATTPVRIQPRVGIVLTDGKSQDDVATPATLAHGFGITLFAIGIGNYDRTELEQIASDPDEAHVFTISDYRIIDNIRTSIRERTCRTPAPATFEEPIGGTLKENETQFIVTPLPEGEPPVVTVTLTSQEGDLGFFASFSFPNPNAALNDASGIVPSGETGYFLAKDDSGINVRESRRRRRRSSAGDTVIGGQVLYMSVVAKSDNARFVLRTQSGDLVPTQKPQFSGVVPLRSTLFGGLLPMLITAVWLLV